MMTRVTTKMEMAMMTIMPPVALAKMTMTTTTMVVCEQHAR
jgi:hypothetical protein